MKNTNYENETLNKTSNISKKHSLSTEDSSLVQTLIKKYDVSESLKEEIFEPVQLVDGLLGEGVKPSELDSFLKMYEVIAENLEGTYFKTKNTELDNDLDIKNDDACLGYHEGRRCSLIKSPNNVEDCVSIQDLVLLTKIQDVNEDTIHNYINAVEDEGMSLEYLMINIREKLSGNYKIEDFKGMSLKNISSTISNKITRNY